MRAGDRSRRTAHPLATAHALSHLLGGGDEIDADKLGISWSPSNYTRTTSPSEVDNVAHLTAHLAGIDALLATLITSGTLVGVDVYTSSTTHTKDAACNRQLVLVGGACGGGAGSGATGAGQGSCAGPGGGGGLCIGFVAAPASSATITIGAAGAAAAAGANNGGTGGTSSFADGTATFTATGGAGGTGSTAFAATRFTGGGGAGGTASGGVLNLNGSGGVGGAVLGNGPTVNTTPPGFVPLFGAPSPTTTTVSTSSAIAGTGRYCGGQGANIGASQPATAGTAGSAGILVVLEFK